MTNELYTTVDLANRLNLSRSEVRAAILELQIGPMGYRQHAPHYDDATMRTIAKHLK